LIPRIEKLRIDLRLLEAAHTYLCFVKWDAEEQLVGIKKIPEGKSGKPKAISANNLLSRIDSMSDEDKAALVAKLQQRIGGEEESM